MEGIDWSKPKRGWIKLNEDRAYEEGLCQAGARAIIFYEHGNVLKVAWAPLEAVSPLYVEAYAMRLGLSLLAFDVHVEVETDSKQLVRILREECAYSWQICNIIHERKTLIKDFNVYNVFHVRKKGNAVAD
ncbi:uncharacterized protein [Typha angustifolia]|uniref:uncharacterized protein n=1 Tax=Typha angustifolia TaxID=59011 RepID=UPI003C2DDB62